MNTELVRTEEGVHRFKQLNKLLIWCPSGKYFKDAPATITKPRELLKFDICTAVLVLQTKHVSAAYNVSHGTKFAICLDGLSRLLKKAEGSARSNHQLLAEMKWRVNKQ